MLFRSSRPGGGGNLLAAEALPDPPPHPPAVEGGYPPGAGTRNGEPLYDFPAKRIVHHLIAETPVRTSSLRGLGATLNVFAIESSMDELAERAGQDPVAYRLAVLSDPRARAVVEHAARMSSWQAQNHRGCVVTRDRRVPSTTSRGVRPRQHHESAQHVARAAQHHVAETACPTRARAAGSASARQGATAAVR